MEAIQRALTAHLSRELGVPAAPDRAHCRSYPMLIVSVEEAGTTLLAGGTQAEHRYKATVTAVSDRDREAATALTARLTPVLLGGIPHGDRVLHPTDIRTKDGTVTFEIALCVALPRAQKPGQAATEHMGALHLEI